ncbi:MAG: hypothetical protein STHCBS139747_003661 [Sporothrix thermara]
MADDRATKRARVSRDGLTEKSVTEDVDKNGSFVLESMSTPVSPPRKRSQKKDVTLESTSVAIEDQNLSEEVMPPPSPPPPPPPFQPPFKTPFQLTAIHDLPDSANIDTVTIRDVFGDPHVTECWEFNFLHDLDFLMSAFHEDARQRGLSVHVVHGFWKREDPQRQRLEAAARQYAEDNSQGGGTTTINLHTAYMPEPFGTHHTKMAVLFRNDDTAQVIIHTANLIPHDWRNMTQAVWRSPLLPLLRAGSDKVAESTKSKDDPDHIGHRFKHDLVTYLRSYNQRRSVCKPLIEALERYDFSAVRGVLIGSVPGRHHVPTSDEKDKHHSDTTYWGWLAMQRALQMVPLRPKSEKSPPTGVGPAEIVVQVSSIATLGGTDTWLQKTLFSALSGGRPAGISDVRSQQLAAFGPLRPQQQQVPHPQFRIMFPTADEIRKSLEGYDSGSSIHAKIQSTQQQKQLAYMRPILCHWANDATGGAALPPVSETCVGDAKRRRAAPHVKTYVRYSNSANACYVDWALLTSANLSKQAWGEARSAGGDMRIASYELGVLVWPELLTGEQEATMQPVFGRDDFGGIEAAPSPANVPLRIPYNLPVQPYGAAEIPWVTSMPHSEPDWRGATTKGWGI